MYPLPKNSGSGGDEEGWGFVALLSLFAYGSYVGGRGERENGVRMRIGWWCEIGRELVIGKNCVLLMERVGVAQREEMGAGRKGFVGFPLLWGVGVFM